MSFFGFGKSAEVSIVLSDQETRRRVPHNVGERKKENLLLFYDGESISGSIKVDLKSAKLDHKGIRVEIIGQIELFNDRGNTHEFLFQVKHLTGPETLTASRNYEFEFLNVEKPYESYTGTNVRLRYFIKATVMRGMAVPNISREMEFCVHMLSAFPNVANPLKMEVGIEDSLHIEFEYNKSRYHLDEAIIGKISFILVRVKIKHMEVDIIRREQTGNGPSTYTETDSIGKYEIMDGGPIKGETIPIRLFLKAFNAQPTMKEVAKKFSVRYYLNLVLVDEEDRRYFKQQEITLWRRAELNENRIPTNQFIGSQLPNGHFKTGKGDSISNQKQASTESSAPESEKPQEAPEAAF